MEEVFSDEVMVGAYVNTCYLGMPAYGNNWKYKTNVPVIYSDDAHHYNTTNNGAVTGYEGFAVSSNYSTMDQTSGGLWGGYGWSGYNSWTYFYTYLYYCNVFLANIESAESVMDPTNYVQWTTEIRLLRAYFFYELCSRYGDIAMILEPCEIGDIGENLVKTSFQEVTDFVLAECDYALSDESLLPWRYETDNDARMTKAVAACLKSRMALYAVSPQFEDESYTMEDGGSHTWEWAYEIASDMLDLCLANGYELYASSVDYNANYKDLDTFANYQDHFVDISNNAYYSYYMLRADYSSSPIDKETIMISKSEQRGDYLYHGPVIIQKAGAGPCPTQELVDSYPMTNGDYVVDLENPYTYSSDNQTVTVNFASGTSYDEQNPYVNRDPRFYGTVLHNQSDFYTNAGVPCELEIYIGGTDATTWSSVDNTPTGYYNRKYSLPTASAQGSERTDWRMMSLGELYLNKAEAAVECGKYSEAEAAVKPLRDRVNMPNIVLSGQSESAARARVRNERRIEFAMQEYRYNDTRRWTPYGEDMECNKILTGMWAIKKDDGSFEYHRLPLGQSMDADGNVTGTTLVRAIGEAKYIRHALYEDEVNKIKLATGDDWQNPGW